MEVSWLLCQVSYTRTIHRHITILLNLCPPRALKPGTRQKSLTSRGIGERLKSQLQENAVALKLILSIALSKHSSLSSTVVQLSSIFSSIHGCLQHRSLILIMSTALHLFPMPSHFFICCTFIISLQPNQRYTLFIHFSCQHPFQSCPSTQLPTSRSVMLVTATMVPKNFITSAFTLLSASRVPHVSAPDNIVAAYIPSSYNDIFAPTEHTLKGLA